MADPRTKDNLPSPCISICQMDAVSEVCLGCYRTRKEIALWRDMSVDDQRDLLDQLNERRAEATGIRRRPSRRAQRRGQTSA